MSESRMRGQDRTILEFTRTPIVFVRRRTIAIERLRLIGSDRSLAFGGADRDRTDDLKLAKLALSQLSYGPRDNNIDDRRSNGGPGTS